MRTAEKHRKTVIISNQTVDSGVCGKDGKDIEDLVVLPEAETSVLEALQFAVVLPCFRLSVFSLLLFLKTKASERQENNNIKNKKTNM